MSISKDSGFRWSDIVQKNGGTEGKSWNTTTIAILAAHNLRAAGYKGYEKPEKLGKIKEALSNADYLALLPGHEVVVSDKLSNRIQIFSEDNKIDRTLVKRVRCRGVTTNRSGMVAYVEDNAGKDKYINMVDSIGGASFARWGEDMVWKPRAICMSNKGQFVITDMNKKEKQIGVYTVDGKCLRQFSPSHRDDVWPTNPCYVIVDPFDRIIVSDRDNHCLKVYDERGIFLNRVGRWDEGSIALPRGVCADSKGNLMVCDAGHNRISVFASDGRFHQHLLTQEDGLCCPRDIALNRQSGRLVVSQNNSNSDSSFRKIRVYEIEKM